MLDPTIMSSEIIIVAPIIVDANHYTIVENRVDNEIYFDKGCHCDVKYCRIRSKYFITADELHKDIIDNIKDYCEHMSINIEDILLGDHRRPLHQTLVISISN